VKGKNEVRGMRAKERKRRGKETEKRFAKNISSRLAVFFVLEDEEGSLSTGDVQEHKNALEGIIAGNIFSFPREMMKRQLGDVFSKGLIELKRVIIHRRRH
jgi:hypothetical protein